ncbi:HGGxSTG domain-containing protein [Vulgatibacter sp.]|uniref:HGGxSTG domain-containing protein n=1 Tax=Vulgatibacter sp. TaxID=1971226 RepID=UPI0035632ACD
MGAAASRQMTPAEIQARAVCGARLPDGRKCGCRPVENPQTGFPRNGRCAAHGGWSTGPRTAEGLARAVTAMFEARGLTPRK